MDSRLSNLFAAVPQRAADEIAETLLTASNLRIERIVSAGQATPPDRWYDQDWSEWVVVLQGNARLLFEGEAAPRRLGAGDFVNIPAHRRHCVTWTDPEATTIWLAIHYR